MSKPPNVLFILSEHHHPSFLGCTGNPITRTPNLDRLAAEGTRFDYTYCASPLCVPARAALFSGRYNHETGVWCNATPWDGTSGGWSFYLRDCGIHIASFGKLDFKPDCDHGINDERLAKHRTSLDIHSLFREQSVIPRYADVEIIRAPRRRTDYPNPSKDDNILAESIRWLRRERPTDRPWLLNVNFFKVHPPWASPPDPWDYYQPKVKLDALSPKYRQPSEDLHPYVRKFSHHQCADYVQPDDIRRAHIGFHSFCEMLDGQIGELIGTLEDLGILDDTMIVYSTDHGSNVHAHRCYNIMSLYEDVARVPLIIRHPGSPKGQIDRTPTHHHDIFPTICEALGLPLSEQFRGKSLFNAVANGDTTPRRRFVLCQMHANAWPAAGFAVSDGHKKYVECVSERPMLFNLDEDPDEMHDLVVERPDNPEVAKTIARMSARLRQLLSPDGVDAQAKADQAQLRRELTQSGRLQTEMGRRGYEPNPERLIPRRDVLDRLGIEALGGCEPGN
jgi:choline-sulfatase